MPKPESVKRSVWVKSRVLTARDCWSDAVIFALVLSLISVGFIYGADFWPFFAFFALWAGWIPYHAVRNYRKIKAVGKPIPFPLSAAWWRYAKGLQWSVLFSTLAGCFLAFWAGGPAEFLFFAPIPVIFGIVSFWGHAQYRKSVRDEAAAEVKAETISTNPSSVRWWTSTETREEIQQAGRK